MKSKWFASPYIVWMVLFILIPLGACAYFAFTDIHTGRFTLDNIKAIGAYLPTFVDSLWLAAISAVISSHLPSLAQPMLMTISTSSAPLSTASEAMKHLLAVVA